MLAKRKKKRSATIRVNNLSSNITEDTLTEHFSVFGEVVGIQIVGDIAFVRFDNASDAATAVLQGSQIEGEEVMLCIEQEKEGEGAGAAGGAAVIIQQEVVQHEDPENENAVLKSPYDDRNSEDDDDDDDDDKERSWKR